MKLQGRLSAMRDFMLIVGLIALGLGVLGFFTFTAAVKNQDGPQKVTLMDLYEGEVGTGAYVKVTGIMFYGMYEYTEDDALVDSYSWLADEKTGDVIVVMDAEANFLTPEPARMTIEGMVRRLPSDLKTLVRDDQVEYPDVYLNDAIYIVEGQTPPNLGGSLMLMLFGLAVGIVGVVFYFVLPPYVFQRRAPAYDAQLTPERPAIKVTANMRKIKALDPLMWSPGEQKFKNGVANLVPYQGALMLYIHQIVKNRVYGVQVSKNETDWGLILDHENVIGVESGSLLGWNEQAALRILYRDKKNKIREALVAFESENGMFTGKALMEKLGFVVEVGEEL